MSETRGTCPSAEERTNSHIRGGEPGDRPQALPTRKVFSMRLLCRKRHTQPTSCGQLLASRRTTASPVPSASRIPIVSRPGGTGRCISGRSRVRHLLSLPKPAANMHNEHWTVLGQPLRGRREGQANQGACPCSIRLVLGGSLYRLTLFPGLAVILVSVAPWRMARPTLLACFRPIRP